MEYKKLVLSYLTAPGWDLYKVLDTPTLSMAHPHTNCPVCKEAKELSYQEQAAVLIASTRGSAQGTLDELHKKGFEIKKTE